MYMSKTYYTLGHIWLVSSKVINFGKPKDYDRPASTIQLVSLATAFITPGTSRKHKAKDVVAVSANECPHLKRNTYFVGRYTQPISTKELWNHLGELPDCYKDELRGAVFPTLLGYGVRL